MYTTETNYYEVDNVDDVSASIRELSGAYAPNNDQSVFKRNFRVRLPSRFKVTGEHIEAAIEAQRQRHRDISGEW